MSKKKVQVSLEYDFALQCEELARREQWNMQQMIVEGLKMLFKRHGASFKPGQPSGFE